MKTKKSRLFAIFTSFLTTIAIAGHLQFQAVPCAASDLVFSVDYKKSRSGAILVLHNKGSQDCSIAARPIVGFENAQQVQLPISWQPPKGMYPGPVLLPINVPKDAWVTSRIHWLSSNAFNNSKCISPAFVTLSIGNDLVRSPFNGNLCGPANKNPTYTITLFKIDSTYTMF